MIVIVWSYESISVADARVRGGDLLLLMMHDMWLMMMMRINIHMIEESTYFRHFLTYT